MKCAITDTVGHIFKLSGKELNSLKKILGQGHEVILLQSVSQLFLVHIFRNGRLQSVQSMFKISFMTCGHCQGLTPFGSVSKP